VKYDDPKKGPPGKEDKYKNPFEEDEESLEKVEEEAEAEYASYSEAEDIGRADTKDLWIVPYADFMSVLMIFFLIMFAFAYSQISENKFNQIVSSIQKEAGGKVKEKLSEEMKETAQMDEAKTKFDKIVENKDLQKDVEINKDANQIKIIFKNPILFDIGKADLKPGSIYVLHAVGQVLKDMKNDIIVEGHTDNIPITGGKYKSNWELSTARAMSVIRYFTMDESLSEERFAAAGYGEYRPVAPNDTEENRGKNRRIEITILKITPAAGALAAGTTVTAEAPVDTVETVQEVTAETAP
jgi:chemotaxis protein MotB